MHNCPIVFACDRMARATLTASWYRQMGFPNVYIVDGGATAWVADGQPLAKSDSPGGPRGYDEGIAGALPAGYEAAKTRVELLTPTALEEQRTGSPAPLLIFVDTSRDFSNGHVPGARWVPRGWLELAIADPAASANFVEMRRISSELADVEQALAAAEDAWLELEDRAP